MRLGNMLKGAITAFGASLALTAAASAQDEDQPNILIIWGDDIGQFNISAYNMGMMGYRTPNIDRIANEGIVFTDAYGQNSCTAGRAAFITGQSPYRTGLLKVGLPGAELGIREEDPTIAGLLREYGYTTGQFGKNHLGDRDEHLPTNHGFDEFFGNLYHLNAEEEPEHPDYPTDPEFRERFGPRGVIHSFADGEINDTGPLNRRRMETVDEETLAAAIDFMDRAQAQDQPFFVWWNATRMHVNTYLQESSVGVTGQGIYADGMVEHDGHVGQLLDYLDAQGIADNTIVMYSTDNGAEVFSWPDGGTIPYRGEKNSTWEGGFRVPMMVRWPDQYEGGRISNEIISQEDWLPTLLAAAGAENLTERLLEGNVRAMDRRYRVHLDGYDFGPYFRGDTDEGPRDRFYYFTDGGQLSALRWGDWKFQFSVSRGEGFDTWVEPFETLRMPLMHNLRQDPFERASIDSAHYQQWIIDHMFLMAPASAMVAEFMATFEEYPVRQRPDSWVPE